MTGVEILNTTHSYASLISPYWALSFCIVALIICVAGFCTVYYDTIQKILFSMVGVVMFGIVVCSIGAFIKTDEIIETKYKVTIDDSVSMTEFMDKYQIIEQEGKIYTVKERE